MSDVTTIDINHIYRDSKFLQIELFSWKIVFICNECKFEKNFFCIDLSKYRLITISLEFFTYDLYFLETVILRTTETSARHSCCVTSAKLVCYVLKFFSLHNSQWLKCNFKVEVGW